MSNPSASGKEMALKFPMTYVVGGDMRSSSKSYKYLINLQNEIDVSSLTTLGRKVKGKCYETNGNSSAKYNTHII